MLQNKINELNSKILENNQQIDNLTNENKNKNNEIKDLRKNVNESQKNTQEKDIMINKLNNKIKMLENFNKKNLLKIIKNNNLNLNNNNDDELINGNKNLNGLKKINSNGGDTILNSDGNDLIIQTLKNKNEELIKDKIKTDNEIAKLNMKYVVTEILSNLFLQLIKDLIFIEIIKKRIKILLY